MALQHELLLRPISGPISVLLASSHLARLQGQLGRLPHQFPAVPSAPRALPSLYPINSTVWNSSHYQDVLVRSAKHRAWPAQPKERDLFLKSPQFFNWVALLAILEVFVWMHIFILLKLPPERERPALMLAMWTVAAVGYNAIFFMRDVQEGLMWNAGYFLELMSLVENIFVFHALIHAFQLPRFLVRKALFVMSCFQIFFQAVLFLGFADALRMAHTFRYILGAWLIFCGYLAIQVGRNETQEGMKLKDSAIYQMMRTCLGDRLAEHYEGNFCVFFDKAAGYHRGTLLLLFLFFLVPAGLSLEIDATLLKIEEIENTFVSFSSSALATLLMPELFLLAEDIFCRCYALKYGIAFALAFFGAQLLLHGLVVIPTIVSCAIVLVVLLLCSLVSLLSRQALEPNQRLGPEADAQHCVH